MREEVRNVNSRSDLQQSDEIIQQVISEVNEAVILLAQTTHYQIEASAHGGIDFSISQITRHQRQSIRRIKTDFTV